MCITTIWRRYVSPILFLVFLAFLLGFCLFFFVIFFSCLVLDALLGAVVLCCPSIACFLGAACRAKSCLS